MTTQTIEGSATQLDEKLELLALYASHDMSKLRSQHKRSSLPLYAFPLHDISQEVGKIDIC